MRQSRNSIITLKNRILLVFLVFFQISLANTPISYTEYNYLVNFFKMASGEKWKTKWDVTTNNVHEGGWYGVTVENGKVVEINLEDNNLEGSIYSGIDNLKGLRSLNLSTNKLTGVAPFNFGNLAALELLNLKDNKLTGISKGFSATLNLDISSQKLDYLVFTYLGDDVEIALPEICVLDAAPNKFKVTILVGNKTNVLEITATEENKLIIPKSFIESCNLDLNVNSTVQILQISGLAINTQLNYSHIGIGNVKIPEAEYNALKELYTSTAGLGWKIRWDISKNNVHEGNWHGVKVENGHVVELNLESNQLRGSIPASINNLKLLRFLNFNNNVALEGTLSKEIEGLKELTALHLYNCRFSGDIPLNFTQMPKLKTIDFRYNQFTTIKAGISRGITLYLHNQNITYDQFRYRGDSVAVKLPNIMLYDYAKDNYSVKNTMYFYINNNYVATMIPNDEGYVKIPKEVLGSLNSKDVVRIYQNNGTSSGTNINFKTIDILTPKIPDSEYEALVAIYKALNGPNWGNSAMLWDVSSNNLHTSVWPGVTIEDGHVVGLNLQQAYYKQGVIPKEIGDLTMLRALNLNRYSYQLTGKLPDEIGNLVNLVTFSATDNKISGEIPTSFGNLTKLKVLDLNTNTLVGSVPSEFSNLQNLETLNLNSNQLSGKLPVFLPELPSLTTLGFYNNNFVGSIPKEYGSKIKLSSLDLRYNKLDSLDSGIARGISVNLEYQSLTRDLFKFTGDTVDIKLPAMMRYNYTKNDYSARNNIYLRLNNGNVGNPLQCNDEGIIRIPKEYFATLNKNHKVSLLQEWASGTSSYSTLTFDSVFIETKKIPDLEYEALVAIYNALNGPKWGNNAMVWDISSNNLHTSVWPGVTIEDGHVVGLNLYQAYYKQGVIPKEIGNLTMLRTLNLDRYSSYITGKLPDEIGNLVNLETFSIANNSLSAEIPTSFNNLAKLKVLNVSYNSLSGSLPSLFATSSALNTVNLYQNKIDNIGEGLKAGMSIDIRYQQPRRDVFIYTGDTVDIQMPSVMLYDYSTNGSVTSNKFDIRYNNAVLATDLYADENGIIRIPKEVLGTLRTQQSALVSIYQNTGTASYSSLIFDSVKVNLDPIPQKEYEALIAIYNKMGGSKWSTKWDVTKGNNVHEGWYGVALENGHVVSINLYNNNLSGNIPVEIGDFSKLRILNLSNYYDYYNRNISGDIPTEIGKLTNLEELYIYNQSLTGELAFWIDKLERLKVIQLYNNYLTGSLPESIQKLTNLQDLNLGINKLEGGIPDRLGNLQYLQYLNLSNNQFKGTIPESLNDLPSITTLYLNNNMFDAMETKLPYQPHITVNIQNQKIVKDKILISGEDYVVYDLPIVSRYDHTRGDLYAANSFYVYVDNSKFPVALKATEMGRLSIPRSYFNNLKTDSKIKLEQADGSAKGTTIEFDEFYIGKPVDDKEYQALVDLYNSADGENWTYPWDVSKNNLDERMWYGVVVEDGHVVKLELQNNRLKGELKESLGQLTSLKQLSLYNNNLTGNIPTSLGTLDSLTNVYLYKNKFTGNIPSSLFDLKNLKELLFNSNQLSGDISDKIATLSKLKVLNISDNSFEGTIPDALFKLPAIKLLDVSLNKYYNMNQAFSYASDVSIYLESQNVEMSDFVLVEGTSVKAKSIKLNQYDKIAHSFDAKNKFELYVDDEMIGQSEIIEDGFIIFNVTLKGYDETDNVYVIQRNGSAYGTTIYYKGVKDASQIQIEETEYLALVSLYNALDGANWTNKWDVSQNNINSGEWYGVNFSNGHITGLELESNKLSGNLPDIFKDLPYLTDFNIAVNSVKGNIPASLMNLESLNKVVLSDNALSAMDEVPFRKSVNLNMARQNVEFPEFNFNLTSEFTVSNIHKYNHSTSSFEKEVSYTLIMGTFNRNIKVSSTYILAQIMKRWSVPHGQLVELQLQGTLAGNNSRNRYYLTFKEGDVDMNDTRNILDIQLLITDMQNQVSSSTYFNETAADVNNDGKRNILDVVAIASLIQNEEMETEDVQTRTFGDKISTLSIEDGILYLNTASPVNAFDIRIKDGNIKEIERIYKDEEMSISIVENDNEISILGFSVSGSAIEGKVAIVKVGDVVIDNAILSNSDAQAISWRVGDYVTGIEDENESLEGKVYNYPNPFETSTTVQFDLLEEPSSAELIIYNITGKIVYREKLTDLIVGTHRLTIDRRNLASGVYPYHVRIQTKHGVKIYNSKMIIK